MLGLGCCSGFPPVAGSGDYPLVAEHGLLSAVVCLVAEHRLQGTRDSVVAAGLWSMWASLVVT